MKVWQPALVLAVVLLCCGLPKSGALGVHLNIPSGPGVVVWEPSESYEGKAQADPRLDRPVKFWRAGMTLPEVFAALREQTGVVLGFDPSDGENARLRVTLFLSPAHAPTLRGVMVQLSWVLDCPFAVTYAGDGYRYSLLRTTVAAGAEARLHKREEQAREDAKQLVGKRYDAMRDKWAELQRALALTPQDLISRYGGVDDRLLLMLLDPGRRALVEVFRGEDWFDRSLRDSLLDLSPGDVGMAFARFSDDFTGGPMKAGVKATQVVIGADGTVSITPLVAVQKPGDTDATLEPAGPECRAIDLRDGAHLSAEEEVTLRRALGERISEKDEAEYLSTRSAQFAAQDRQREVEHAQARLLTGSALSPRARADLSALVLPLDRNARLAPWEVQEAVARASGFSVVSDSFCQGSGPLAPSLSLVDAAAAPGATALWALGAISGPSGASELGGLEWGDAGAFLRFRSADRDVWRASLLPPDFLQWADDVLRPHLPPDAGTGPVSQAELSITVVLGDWTRRLAGLSEMQTRFGGTLCYASPGDRTAAYRQAFVSALLTQALDPRCFVRFFATLNDEQWNAVRMPDGLRCGPDLSPDQRARLTEALLALGLQADELRHLQEAKLALHEPGPGGKAYLIDVTHLLRWEEPGLPDYFHAGYLPGVLTVRVEPCDACSRGPAAEGTPRATAACH
ncbi:MAG: hypothetical protein ABSD48_16300 [Armatimonadota bacterium]|jgi:hypothetical protein